MIKDMKVDETTLEEYMKWMYNSSVVGVTTEPITWPVKGEMLQIKVMKTIIIAGMCMYTYVPSHFSCVWLFVTLRTVACQAPLSMGFSRQEYWSGLACPFPGNLPDPGIEPVSLMSPALAGVFFTTATTSEALFHDSWITEFLFFKLNLKNVFAPQVFPPI